MPEGIPLHRMQSENFFWNSFQKEVSFRRTHILAKVYKCALPLKLQRSVYSNGSSSSSVTLINPSFSSLESVSDAFLLSAKKCSSTTTLLLYLFTPSLSVYYLLIPEVAMTLTVQKVHDANPTNIKFFVCLVLLF